MGEGKPHYKKNPETLVAVAQRQENVWGLRVQGMSFRQIAKAIGIGVATVHRDIKAERAELTQEAADEIACHKATLIAREEAIIETHWPMRHEPDSAKVVQASNKMIAQLSGALIVRNELTGKDGAPLAPTTLNLYTDEQLERIARGQSVGPASEGDPGTPQTGAAEDGEAC